MPGHEESRPLSDYVSLLRRRWWLVALVTVVALGAAAAYTFRQRVVYRSEMQIVVGQGQGIFLANSGNVAEQFTQTMASLVQTDTVASGVIQDLNLKMSPDELLKNLHVVTKPQTAVLQVLYDHTNRPRGRSILQDVGAVFTRLVNEKLVHPAIAPGPNGTDSQVTATVFDQAHYVPGRVEPKPVRNLAVAGVLGLLLGLMVAFVREQFDDTIRGLEEAEGAFGQTATATLPPGLVGYRPLATTKKDRGKMDPLVAQLAFQKLRATILWSPDARHARTFVVTSAQAEEGKTTVASNLAFAIAGEGHDVILVEADLRRPSLHKYLALLAAPSFIGLDDVLRGSIPLDDALIDMPLPVVAPFSSNGQPEGSSGPPGDAQGRLRAVLSAPAKGWSAEFGLDRVVQLLDDLQKLADYVIIDTPPLVLVSDAYPFIAAADAVIAVVRNGRASEGATIEMSRTLKRLRPRRVELVVTDVEPSFGSYADYRSTERAGRS